MVRRLPKDDVYCSAGSVAAKKRSLWSTQHFDAFDIKQTKVVGILTSNENVIDIGAYWHVLRRDRLRVADAAYVVGIGASQADVVVADEVGNEADQVDCVADLLL